MEKKNSKLNTYLIGGLGGALFGLAAAFLIEKASDIEGEKLQFSGKKLSRAAGRAISLLWSLVDK